MVASPKTIDEFTTVELLRVAQERATLSRDKMARTADERGRAVRDYSLTITHIEDAIMRHNRGVAIERGIFVVADLEQIDPGAAA